MIKEYDKIRLKSGLIARIAEVLEQGNMYIGEVFGANGKVSIEHIAQDEILSVFVETETPLRMLA